MQNSLAIFLQQAGIVDPAQQIALITVVTEQPPATIATWGEGYGGMPEYYQGMLMGYFRAYAGLSEVLGQLQQMQQQQAEQDFYWEQQRANADLQRQFAVDSYRSAMRLGEAAINGYVDRAAAQRNVMANLSTMRY